jgi:hypothetical protein
MLARYSRYQFAVTDISLIKRHVGGNSGAMSTHQVIEDDNVLAARPQ